MTEPMRDSLFICIKARNARTLHEQGTNLVHAEYDRSVLVGEVERLREENADLVRQLESLRRQMAAAEAGDAR